MKLIILKNHFDGKDTIFCNNYVMNGCQFWDIRDEEDTQRILDDYEVTQEQWQEVLDAIEAGKGNTETSKSLVDFAFLYCRDVKLDPEMRQIILDDLNAERAYYWCNIIDRNDDDMRQVIIDAFDPKWAFFYCHYISEDTDMRQVIIDSGDPHWACYYLEGVNKKDDDMKKVIVDSGDPEWAYWYCRNVKDDPNMRQIILDAKNPKYACHYCCFISDDADMRQIILDAQDPQEAILYLKGSLKRIDEVDNQMQEIVDNNKDNPLVKILEILSNERETFEGKEI